MFDLKVINSVLEQLEEERGVPREKVMETIELALATAYKKEFGKRGQFIRAHFDLGTGKTDFSQIKVVVDENSVIFDTDDTENADGSNQNNSQQGHSNHNFDQNFETKQVGEDGQEIKPRFNPEHHILIEDAKKIKKGIAVGEEMVFPLENKDDFGRIAAQTAKQVIIQKIREAEKVSVLAEFGKREGEILSGTVQRMERGNIFFDMGRAQGMLPYEEQIPGERYKQGERVRMYLTRVEETPRGIFLRLSRSHPKFLAKLFEVEVPEIQAGTVVVKSVAREAGARSKIAVFSNDPHVDPVGSMVGQRGVRVNTVSSELGGEKIDIIDWKEDASEFIKEALSPAKVNEIKLEPETMVAHVIVNDDQQSLAIGKGGQNVRLAAKLTGWKIDIQSSGKPTPTEDGNEVQVEIVKKDEIKNEALTDAIAEATTDVVIETKETPTE